MPTLHISALRLAEAQPSQSWLSTACHDVDSGESRRSSSEHGDEACGCLELQAELYESCSVVGISWMVLFRALRKSQNGKDRARQHARESYGSISGV
ncbi:hypothetical protein SeMB42_g00536 [Synchytrium endobioticum]|uniref:Uncharacterized protein n=1 Tax=Synchytrium endobioticum TaxID=286115 RepID=A0A507DQP2_9FUNG|nr:hypothetical protein SeLEV6574_g00039 [Synchytrium endobioticum]TPX53983.1 hypothetical protein SeMB42_g00536 [Synchytrium endobioticum]